MKKHGSIITGAGSGLGLELARKLSRNGYALFLVGRDRDKLNRTKEAVSQISTSDIFVFSGDISDEAFVEDMYKSIDSWNYQLDFLFNCAGLGLYGNPENATRKMIDEVFAANLIGLMLMSTKALLYMADNGGTIVNIMSSAAKKGNAKEAVYCAAKWGARGYSEAIKAATKGTKIKVVQVFPGGMKTPFWNGENGLKHDTSNFMEAEEVAEQIIQATRARETMYVGEIVIERL